MPVILIRTVIMYMLVIAAIRIMGKRQIGELEPSELVVTIMISEIASMPIQSPEIPLLSGIIPITTLIGLEMLMSSLLLKSIRFRRLVSGSPTLLMENGVILQKELKKNRLSVDELVEDLRLQSVYDLSTVQYAILETNGQLSAVLYSEHRPMAAGRHGEGGRGLPVELISDGRVIKRNLIRTGRDEGWIEKEIRRHGGKTPADVFLLTVDEQGGVYYLPREKN